MIEFKLSLFDKGEVWLISKFSDDLVCLSGTFFLNKRKFNVCAMYKHREDSWFLQNHDSWVVDSVDPLKNISDITLSKIRISLFNQLPFVLRQTEKHSEKPEV